MQIYNNQSCPFIYTLTEYTSCRLLLARKLRVLLSCGSNFARKYPSHDRPGGWGAELGEKKCSPLQKQSSPFLSLQNYSYILRACECKLTCAISDVLDRCVAKSPLCSALYNRSE